MRAAPQSTLARPCQPDPTRPRWRSSTFGNACGIRSELSQTLRCRNRKSYEVVSCSITNSVRTNPLKNDLPKKRSALEQRPNYFRLALDRRTYPQGSPSRDRLAHQPMAFIAPGFNHPSQHRSAAWNLRAQCPPEPADFPGPLGERSSNEVRGFPERPGPAGIASWVVAFPPDWRRPARPRLRLSQSPARSWLSCGTHRQCSTLHRLVQPARAAAGTISPQHPADGRRLTRHRDATDRRNTPIRLALPDWAAVPSQPLTEACAASTAARCMLDDISLVTVLCSLTAAAVEVTYALTFWMACLMEFRASTTSPDIPLSGPISFVIMSVACFVVLVTEQGQQRKNRRCHNARDLMSRCVAPSAGLASVPT